MESQTKLEALEANVRYCADALARAEERFQREGGRPSAFGSRQSERDCESAELELRGAEKALAEYKQRLTSLEEAFDRACDANAKACDDYERAYVSLEQAEEFGHATSQMRSRVRKLKEAAEKSAKRYDATQKAWLDALDAPADAPQLPAVVTVDSRADLAEIENLLHGALASLQTKGGEGSMAWRLADAGLLLRKVLEAQGKQGTGITHATGRGALLPLPNARYTPF
jgi:predicted RNase H-like nuclease (RuvC/YqgF family)